MDPQAPPVVAVVVTKDPGDWFEEALRSLAAQDYPNLSVLVVDAGSAEDPTPRVAQVLPGAFVRRLGRPTGYAEAANEAITVVEGAAFYAMCHDDVAPDPDAVGLLVEEAYRSNAGVVSPKLVSWDDPTRLLQVGMSADRGGVPVAFAQPGELDQEQHDSVRDVFVAPGGLMLVRADLFATLGGFDPGIVLFGEDVDLSWRAQVAGARVIVAPAARARHRAALSSGLRAIPDLPGIPAERRPGGTRLTLQRRHELRAALSDYGRWHLVRVLPLLVLHTVGEVMAGVAGGHPEMARAAVRAWAWNLARSGDIRRRRRALAGQRRLGDGEVRRLQTTGSARVGALVADAFTRASSLSDLSYVPHLPHLATPVPLDDDAAEAIGAPGRHPTEAWVPPALALLAAAAFLFGSRGIFSSGLPFTGQFAPFPGVGRLLGSYASSIRPTGAGLGQVAPAPLALALFGLLSGLLADSPGLARTVAVVGMLPAGAFGAYWSARRLESRWARLAAPALYLALPLPYDDIAHGRWGALVAYGAAPWLIGLFLAATGRPPFAEAGRRPWRLWLAGGMVTALAGAVAPGLAVAILVAGVGAVAASLLAPDSELLAMLRGLGGLVLMAVVGWLLAFPWSAGLVGAGGQAGAVFGVREAVFRATGLGALLGFHVVPGGANWPGWVLLPGAAL
ncbi:MAG TPA: glycosyltransferase family 2 protein, partial [Acidimicrobiales bacterium]|nr:glycosyltransferase family 2 protein [Acidimicrobiales bacterium]